MNNINLRDIIIKRGSSIHDAMALIDKNAKGTLFVVGDDERLCGVVTDGDIRRGLIKGVTLKDKLTTVMNSSFVALKESVAFEDIADQLKAKYKYIPILDGNGRIVDYYSFIFNVRIPVAKPSLSGNEAKYLMECIATNWISSQGKFVEKFESQFAEYLGVRYALSTCNGTAALHLALEALGIKEGDEVLVPALTFIATANAVTYTGAKPIFCDSELDTFNINPRDLEKRLTERTKAIIPVHLYGQPAKMDEIMEIAKRNDLYVIEDAAEAHGAEYKGNKVGTLGDVGIFSFYGNKIITTGEGGMLTTNNPKTYESVKKLRDHAMDENKKYWHNRVGFNYRMTNLQAAVGCAQLERIDDIIKNKMEIMKRYDKYFKEIETLGLSPRNEFSKNVCWMYSLIIDEKKNGFTRDSLMDHLLEKNIECRHFFYPINEMPPYYDSQILPNAHYLSNSGMNIPSYATITKEEITNISKIILKFINQGI
jgi:perosamine synthetase|tara:strand:- start:738 stop:2183 length:1446 start_codon:yes stop_codon:yes gene_type:complete